MKTAAKVLVGFVIVIAIVLGAGYWFVQTQAPSIAQNTVTEATGSEELGDLASKVVSGEDLSDSEIQEALGVDDATYQKVKEAASQAGVDLNDSSQLKELAASNASNISEIEDIVSSVQAGTMSESEAASKIEELVK